MQFESTGNLVVGERELSSKTALTPDGSPSKVGYGVSMAHHGELFQGVIEDDNGRLRRGLVTIPCGILRSEVSFTPDSTGVLKVEPECKCKTLRAVELALRSMGIEKPGGTVRVRSNIPKNWGFGSSTSDVTAAIRAVAASLGRSLTAKEIAAIAVQAETASDSIMYDHMVMFAHREGIVIEDFKVSLPPLDVLGFNTDPKGIGIKTLNIPHTHYSWWEVEAFRPILGLLRCAVELRSPQLLGQVATASATINQQYLPKPHFDHLIGLCEKVGAVGFQVAHSGTVAGFLFDPEETMNENRIQYAQTLVTEMGINQSWVFHTGENGPQDKQEGRV